MENRLLLEEPIGSMLVAKVHVFSDTGLGELGSVSASKILGTEGRSSHEK